jgi:predicted O-methyltransferase YrrM
LELGCGDFSTATLLNREVFSDLVQLHSYETDPAWLEKTASVFHGDDRFQLQLIPGSMSSALRETKVETFDMIFVDNSTSAVERAETIRHLVTRSVPNQLIVIHDFEVKDYRDAASTFEHKQIFRAFTPQTAVVWNGLRHQLEILKKLSRQITQESKNIAVDDVIGWRRVLREE